MNKVTRKNKEYDFDILFRKHFYIIASLPTCTQGCLRFFWYIESIISRCWRNFSSPPHHGYQSTASNLDVIGRAICILSFIQMEWILSKQSKGNCEIEETMKTTLWTHVIFLENHKINKIGRRIFKIWIKIE